MLKNEDTNSLCTYFVINNTNVGSKGFLSVILADGQRDAQIQRWFTKPFEVLALLIASRRCFQMIKRKDMD